MFNIFKNEYYKNLEISNKRTSDLQAKADKNFKLIQA